METLCSTLMILFPDSSLAVPDASPLAESHLTNLQVARSSGAIELRARPEDADARGSSNALPLAVRASASRKARAVERDPALGVVQLAVTEHYSAAAVLVRVVAFG